MSHMVEHVEGMTYRMVLHRTGSSASSFLFQATSEGRRSDMAGLNRTHFTDIDRSILLHDLAKPWSPEQMIRMADRLDANVQYQRIAAMLRQGASALNVGEKLKSWLDNEMADAEDANLGFTDRALALREVRNLMVALQMKPIDVEQCSGPPICGSKGRS